ARFRRTVFAYSEAVGATEGSIMAAIISVQAGTNAARARPIVPVIPAIPRARATVATQAPAATTSSSAASRVASADRGPGGAAGAVDDAGPLHAQHLPDERAEHRGRPARLPGQDRSEMLGLVVGRGVIEEDADPPVALAHHRRRVQEQGEAQPAHVDVVDLA